MSQAASTAVDRLEASLRADSDAIMRSLRQVKLDCAFEAYGAPKKKLSDHKQTGVLSRVSWLPTSWITHS